jgi:hypothetical protein
LWAVIRDWVQFELLIRESEMSRVYLTTAVACFALAVRTVLSTVSPAVETAGSRSTPAIHMEPAEFTGEAVLVGGEFLATFEITNRSPTAVQLTDVQVECGCTRPALKDRRLESGASTELQVHVSGQTVGELRKRLKVHWVSEVDPMSRGSVECHVAAPVEPPFTADPPVIQLKALAPGESEADSQTVSTVLLTLRPTDSFRRIEHSPTEGVGAYSRNRWLKVTPVEGQPLSFEVSLAAGPLPEHAYSSEIVVFADRHAGRSVSVPVTVSRRGSKQ